VRDIIWTVILIWVVYKIYETFKSVSRTRTQAQGFNSNQSNYYHHKKEGEVRVDPTASKQKTHFKPEDGEYVDYEEIK